MRLLSMKNRTPLQKLLMLSALSSGGSVVEDTATGNPVTFETDLAKPLKSLVASFLPIQSGTGDPSTDNIRPITGWDAVNAWCAGKNLLDPSTLKQGGINSDGVAVSNPKRIRTDYIPVKENTYYSLSAGAEYKAFMHFYDKDKGNIGNNTVAKAKAPTGACFVRGIIGYQDETNIVPSDCTTGQLEVVAQNGLETEYEPFVSLDTYPVTWQTHGTIYGGYVDLVTGEVWATWPEIASYDGETLPGRWLSDRDVYSAGSTPTTGAQVVYELSTPILITTLTPQQINAIKGQTNTVWSDANGDCEVTFLKKG